MKKHLSTIILVAIFLVGLGVILYPTVSDYLNDKNQSKAIVNYEAVLSGLSEEDSSELFAAAEVYNEALREVPFPFMNYEQVEGYDALLNVGDLGIVGYVTINKINVKLPIYHGTSPAVLNVAVGHLQGSSLPTGGKNTHCVLSAHRGLPSAELFSNLDDMAIGDRFTLTVLDRVLIYEVDQIRIVEPEEVEELYIKEGEDYCTLFTCTPYGINTHRLLVRGTRVLDVNGEPQTPAPQVITEAKKIDPMTFAPVIAAVLLLALLVVLLVKYRKKK